MASVIDVCNLALTHIGDQGNVASIDPPEGSAQARYCARFYPLARDLMLEAHTWRFNTRRVVLTSVVLPAAVGGEWAEAYALPANCLRPFHVYVPGVTAQGRTEDFTVETADDGSQLVLTNVEDAYLKYVIRATDTTRYPPSVVQALSFLLASQLAGPITKDDQKVKALEQKYLLWLDHAKALDASTQSAEDWRTDQAPKWVTER